MSVLRSLVTVCVLVAVIGANALGNEEAVAIEPTTPKSPHVLEQKRTVLEIGAAGGFPLGLAAQIGVWNIAGTPMFARVASGFFFLGGALEGEIGYLFDSVGRYKQYVSVGGGTYSLVVPLVPILFTETKGFYVGPQYGAIFWDFITFSAGVAVFASSSSGGLFLLPISDSSTGIAPFGKIGISLFF